MILYFSGTGNSRIAAKFLSSILGDETTHIVTAGLNVPVNSNERIIWVFPIYSWGVPPVVRRYISQVHFCGRTGGHFMVCTCGDDIGLAHKMWRKDVGARGWCAIGTFSVIMPNTYTLLPFFDIDPPDVVYEKLRCAPTRLELIARAISRYERVDDVTCGGGAWIKTHIAYPLFTRFLMSPRPFGSTAACISCSKCASGCPMGNITLVDGRPVWGDDCAMCLGCYHACPQHAVAYGRRTLRKGQYNAPSEFGRAQSI